MINAVMHKTSKERSINGNVFKTPFHLKPHLIIGYVGAIINVSNGRYSPAVPNVQTHGHTQNGKRSGQDRSLQLDRGCSNIVGKGIDPSVPRIAAAAGYANRRTGRETRPLQNAKRQYVKNP